MKPLPDLEDAERMASLGRERALYAARREAMEALRDAYTLMQSASWQALQGHADAAAEAALRLKTVAELWHAL